MIRNEKHYNLVEEETNESIDRNTFIKIINMNKRSCAKSIGQIIVINPHKNIASCM